jgi:2-polyprenyl-3-methyl-5-hydroxy-6-metoxy-1,4-benzoquinol methylase
LTDRDLPDWTSKFRFSLLSRQAAISVRGLDIFQMSKRTDELRELYSAKPDAYFGLSRQEMIPFVPLRCKKILEVGCGRGSFGALLKERIPGCQVWGIEPDNSAAEIAATRLDKVVVGMFSVRAEELKTIRFDAICFNDVLEHMIDPCRTLSDCRELLTDNGVVIASLPNILFFYQIVRILIEQDWRYEDSGIMDETHLRFFTRKSIVRMFKSSGFDIEHIEGVNASYGLKFLLANALTFGWLSDWKYVQFGVRARPVARGGIEEMASGDVIHSKLWM